MIKTSNFKSFIYLKLSRITGNIWPNWPMILIPECNSDPAMRYIDTISVHESVVCAIAQYVIVVRVKHPLVSHIITGPVVSDQELLE